MFGKRIQLHERGGIEHGDTLNTFDREWLWSVTSIDHNQGRGDFSRLAVIERDLKRFGGGKVSLAPEQIQPLCRGQTVLVAVARSLDDPLFALADGLQVDRNRA